MVERIGQREDENECDRDKGRKNRVEGRKRVEMERNEKEEVSGKNESDRDEWRKEGMIEGNEGVR